MPFASERLARLLDDMGWARSLTPKPVRAIVPREEMISFIVIIMAYYVDDDMRLLPRLTRPFGTDRTSRVQPGCRSRIRGSSHRDRRVGNGEFAYDLATSTGS
ncbi:hypothetical protein ZHAS_00007932 [Anopheles sinensis]|uniref:Uncharacterized protein n=1 Tax=Anopheles sinensis TaxID=74873 RepID=A0A084VR58_ANOSI|nr:hypothetical protein ZHAS_00007932 [Anopheles sinensis]